MILIIITNLSLLKYYFYIFLFYNSLICLLKFCKISAQSRFHLNVKPFADRRDWLGASDKEHGLGWWHRYTSVRLFWPQRLAKYTHTQKKIVLSNIMKSLLNPTLSIRIRDKTKWHITYENSHDFNPLHEILIS